MNTQELKNEVQKGLRAYKAFEQGEKLLVALESVEQNLTETQKRLDAVKAEEAQWAINKAEALEDIEDSKKMADNILKSANESAADIVASGIEKVDDERTKLAEEKNAAISTLKALKDQTDASKANLDTLDSLVMEAQADLDKIKAEKKKLLDSLAG